MNNYLNGCTLVGISMEEKKGICHETNNLQNMPKKSSTFKPTFGWNASDWERGEPKLEKPIEFW